MIISEEEKSQILDMHQNEKSHENEFKEGIIDWNDEGNVKALRSQMGIRDKKQYKIVVKEPFVIDTKNEDDFYKLKFILMKHGIPTEVSITDL